MNLRKMDQKPRVVGFAFVPLRAVFLDGIRWLRSDSVMMAPFIELACAAVGVCCRL